ncbi:DUF2442 domain-containing protein [Edwardsiella ictaluri]|uniref:DUF2442 domain-containing protein n=1 Tax=Edwardsiella ictaluri TaxID=67780 RepID=UPI0018DD995F|nr:DUF2442 domain-containing protein [Edwardsiella ictaluri]QPW28838.1 DUF2442 domain-containing protein [Edwardsiella ictaluri]UYB61954.1 DUF2442 domain-containing protein [Edwardsiella ictaluri]UYB65179.1 DUF2442 domain-containing protein [Edwardsiella ictaluri]WJH19911.1 DUF2442 domain-containing protein [Edwardsiella ictaluri]BEH97515.1 DUF2442 domain-containing protein [Edwardsiella ictaluri]
MLTLQSGNDIRVMNVYIDDDRLTVDLMDGRSISVPVAWFPRLAAGTAEQRQNWELCGAGYGIHWPELDEDLSTEGLLRGAKGVAPRH